jgi:hypothetical protein
MPDIEVKNLLKQNEKPLLQIFIFYRPDPFN